MTWFHALTVFLCLTWNSFQKSINDRFFNNSPIQQTQWFVRFSGNSFQLNQAWPRGIQIQSIHEPIQGFVISTSMDEKELLHQLNSIRGIIRIEQGFTDSKGSPVYPTGLALVEPLSAQASVFLTETLHVKPIQTLDALGWMIVEIPTHCTFAEFKIRCMASGLIKDVHRDEIVQGYSMQTNDPMYGTSWHIQQANDADIDAPEGWSLLGGNNSTKSIAIIEGVGFDTLNTDLAGRFIDRYNATNNSSNVYSNTTNEKHGTATSGIPCAIANNAISAAGIGYNKLKVQAIRIGYNVNASGNFTSTSVMQAAAINRAMAQSTTVAISMSISFSTFQSAMQSAITNARIQGRSNKGIPVFASSGNSGLSTWTNYPASYAGVIAVGATTSTDQRASFSNFGAGVTLCAPGSSIATTDITGTNGYSAGDNTYFSGTSAACPVAATVGALMVVLNDQITESQIKQYMAQSCDKVGGYSYGSSSTNSYSTWSNELGYGRVNLYNALLLASGSNETLFDISLSAASLSTNSPQVNQSITISCAQQINLSVPTALQSTLEYRYSTDEIWSSDDIIIGTDVSSLGNGVNSENESVTYTIPAGTGTRFILIRADANGVHAESNETNNLVILPITLQSASNSPDVFIASASVSSVNVISGQTITISCAHATTSATTQIYPSLQYRLSTDALWQSSDTYIGNDVSTFNSSVLSENENITYTIPNITGTRYVLIKADAGNSVVESNENNNVYVIPITIAAAFEEQDDYTYDEKEKACLFPNPGSSFIKIISPSFEWQHMSILTTNGMSVLSADNSPNHPTTEIDIQSLKRGCYLVQLINENRIETLRLIVE
jgi:hypothetical protein